MFALSRLLRECKVTQHEGVGVNARVMGVN